MALERDTTFRNKGTGKTTLLLAKSLASTEGVCLGKTQPEKYNKDGRA